MHRSIELAGGRSSARALSRASTWRVTAMLKTMNAVPTALRIRTAVLFQSTLYEMR